MFARRHTSPTKSEKCCLWSQFHSCLSSFPPPETLATLSSSPLLQLSSRAFQEQRFAQEATDQNGRTKTTLETPLLRYFFFSFSRFEELGFIRFGQIFRRNFCMPAPGFIATRFVSFAPKDNMHASCRVARCSTSVIVTSWEVKYPEKTVKAIFTTISRRDDFVVYRLLFFLRCGLSLINISEEKKKAAQEPVLSEDQNRTNTYRPR